MLTDDNKDLRKCLKMAKLLERVGKELCELAEQNREDPVTGRIFEELADLGWVIKTACGYRDEVIEAAEDWINPERHNPTHKFSEPRGE